MEVLVRRTRQSDYEALSLSLSHGSLTMGLLDSPWYMRGYPNAVRYMYDPKEGPSYNTGESQRIPLSRRAVDQLSPHHDSQFLAFSTEVFVHVNQKHNRSSSPFTTLADRAERKVASTGAGQPNY